MEQFTLCLSIRFRGSNERRRAVVPFTSVYQRSNKISSYAVIPRRVKAINSFDSLYSVRSLRSNEIPIREIHFRASYPLLGGRGAKKLVRVDEGFDGGTVFPWRWMKKVVQTESGTDKWTSSVQPLREGESREISYQGYPTWFPSFFKRSTKN